MKAEVFDLFALLIKQRSGMVLEREKSYMLESRLLPIARKWNLKTLEDMATAVRVSRDERMMAAITEAMAASETWFFRDRLVFKNIRENLLPLIIAGRQNKRQIRLWSAAMSSGQEAYSLAMICIELADMLDGWKIDVIGTDLSNDLVERAKTGIYTQLEIQRGLPIRYLVKYFQNAMAGGGWQVKDPIRKMVQMRTSNLLKDFGPVGICDIILCRNVLDGFDTPTQKRVFDALGGIIAPDGFLILGAGETAGLSTDKFKRTPDGSALILSAPPKGH